MIPWPNGIIGASSPAGGFPSLIPASGRLGAVLEQFRSYPLAQAALRGVTPLWSAPFSRPYNPVWTSGIHNGADYVIALAAFVMLFMWQAPPWLVVILCAAAGAAVGYL